MARLKQMAIMLLGLLTASVTGACSNMHYVSNASLRDTRLALVHEEDAAKAPQKFGAIRVVTPAHGDSLDAVPQERLFILKRSGKTYMAETLLFDHSDDDKANFEKSFLAFGTDRENSSVGLQLRFVD